MKVAAANAIAGLAREDALMNTLQWVEKDLNMEKIILYLQHLIQD